MTDYVLNEAKMFADITDGIAIVINSETGIYYGMNGLGTAVFERLAGGADSEAVLASLKGISGAPADIEARFSAFMGFLLEKELIVAGGAGDGAADIDSKVASADDFVLGVDEYNDAQELLLADPIHEVKEDSGWTPEKSSLNPDAGDVARREAKAK